MRPATLRAAGADGAGSLSGRAASVAAAGRGREPSGASGGARRAVQDAKGGTAGERRRCRPASPPIGRWLLSRPQAARRAVGRTQQGADGA